QRRWGHARDLLSAAAARFRSLGAPGWETRVLLELGRVGGRTPAARTLTASELEAAHHAAAGRSNKEIARACGVAVRTVEDQLSSAYAKLGIRSRVQLGTALAALAALGGAGGAGDAEEAVDIHD
ncbi:MAG: LuxR C-terminal-related transcriptional regulator, partial [Nocardioides sp.]|uniref:response regulator transcription factor n=1 Tax=Nocardioides sp. TaxID=35761 RepID=UPI0039E3091C